MSADTMQSKLFVSCHCGQFKALVPIDEQGKPTRLKCYCVDCPTYARHLNQAEVQLDDNGGTDILQISPAQFSITAGEERLGNLMLSPKGIYRWHTSCCQTPICNTPTKAEMPYVGLLLNNISNITNANINTNHQQSSGQGRNKTLTDENRLAQLQNVIGPVQFGVGAGIKHPINADWPVSKGFGFRGMFGTLRNMAIWRIRGDHKRSIFIDSVNGKPLVQPTLFTIGQRQAARNKV
ncbi:MAG: hypothetical protein ACI8UP_002142 [Porticoccaceae bacterium]|jgi:hypothetical protein